jgi:predicted transcriptional regulator
MVPLKGRLSLDWLKEAQGRRPTSNAWDGVRNQKIGGNLSPHLEDALLASATRLLVAIRERPTKTAYLHDLVTQLGLNLSDTLPVVEYLIERGHLKKLEDDKLGNYKLYLTDQGEQLVAKAGV